MTDQPTQSGGWPQRLSVWATAQHTSQVQRRGRYVPVDQAAAQLSRKLADMPAVRADGDAVLQHLLERSGVLRKPVEGRLDFLHRTFQEYLAAKAAVHADDLGALANHALDWREVVILAAGLVPTRQLSGLMRSLLDPDHPDGAERRLLALRCLETAQELPADVQGLVTEAASSITPPQTMEQAIALAGCGELALDLIDSARPPQGTAEVRATIRTLGLIGGQRALDLMARFSTLEPRLSDWVSAWTNFDREEYARRVLHATESVWLDNESLAPSLRFLPKLTDLLLSHATADLSFVPDLPHLTELTLATDAGLPAPDLGQLRGTGLQQLRLYSRTGNGHLPADVHVLGELASLERLTVMDRPVAGLAGLTRAARLRHVVFLSLPADEFDALRRLTRLTVCVIGGNDRVSTLDDLDFLTAPEYVGLVDGRGLRDLQPSPGWNLSLRRLQLPVGPRADLAGLAGLRALEDLTLTRVDGSNLEPLAGMDQLRRLTLTPAPHRPANPRSARPIDLRELARATQLRSLNLHGGGEYDLSLLTGLPELRITVDEGTTVHGPSPLIRTVRT